jgi:hypothetical protein
VLVAGCIWQLARNTLQLHASPCPPPAPRAPAAYWCAVPRCSADTLRVPCSRGHCTAAAATHRARRAAGSEQRAATTQGGRGRLDGWMAVDTPLYTSTRLHVHGWRRPVSHPCSCAGANTRPSVPGIETTGQLGSQPAKPCFLPLGSAAVRPSPSTCMQTTRCPLGSRASSFVRCSSPPAHHLSF